jgi:hypothetical protein
LWHWFHMFYHVIGVERKTHFKDTLLSHYASNETQLQRWTFKLESEGTQKLARKNRARGVSQTLDRQNPMGIIPQGLSKNVGLTVSTQVYSSQLLLVRWCWSFFSIWFAVWTTYLPAVHGLRHATGWSAWFIVRINSQHGQSEISCNTKCLKHF